MGLKGTQEDPHDGQRVISFHLGSWRSCPQRATQRGLGISNTLPSGLRTGGDKNSTENNHPRVSLWCGADRGRSPWGGELEIEPVHRGSGGRGGSGQAPGPQH